jgi:hypothetical protein
MPRGYGRGYEMGRGYWGWYARGRGNWPAYGQLTAGDVSGEATYVGPCRCGFGPHAYYRSKNGRLAHASAMWPALTLPVVSHETELEQLRREKEQLEEEIRILETDLAKTKAVAPEKKKD